MDSQLATSNVKLSEREQKALDKYERSHDKMPLGVDAALPLYDLFLNGCSCEEIFKINKKLGKGFTLGHIVDARIRYGWDERKDAHLKELFDGVMLRAKKTQADAIEFVSDQIAAMKAEFGDRIKMYLQTGNRLDLPDEFRIATPTALENAIRLFRLLTGQSDGGGKGGGTQVNIVAGSANVSATQDKKSLDSQDVHKLLEMVVEGEVKK